MTISEPTTLLTNVVLAVAAAALGIRLLAARLAAGIAAQQARVPGPGPFNHNDVCHVLQTAALWPFYRIGRRLRDAEPSGPPLTPDGGHTPSAPRGQR